MNKTAQCQSHLPLLCGHTHGPAALRTQVEDPFLLDTRMSESHNRSGQGKKIKLSLCLLNQALGHEDVWENGGIDPPFLTSALDREE
jgi:hypothetical protein